MDNRLSVVTRSVADVVRPKRLTLDLDRKISRFGGRVTETSRGTEILARDAPDETIRAELAARRTELRGSLTPSDADWIGMNVGALMGVRAGQPDDPEDRLRVLQIYVATLVPLPRFALEAAFNDARTGRIGLPHTMPTEAEIFQAAERHSAWVHAELRLLNRIVDAKVIDIPVNPELRRKSVAAIDDVVESIRRAGEEAEAQRVGVLWRPPPTRARETPQETLARLRDQPVPQLSSEALRIFRKQEVDTPIDDELRTAR